MSETVPLMSGQPRTHSTASASTTTTTSSFSSTTTSPPSSLDNVSIHSSKTSTKLRRAPSSTSIQLSTSFKDWWSSSSLLSKHPTSISSSFNNKSMQNAMLKNRIVEYDLFRAILSPNIFLLPPDLSNCHYDPQGNDTTNDWKQGHAFVGQLLDVPINDDLTIHEFYLENNTVTDQSVEQTHIVIIHGYMAAVGYFIKNVETLLKSKPGVRIHLIDLPGFGNSSRPQFPAEYLLQPTIKTEQIAQVLQVEDWFIDKIENWRSVRKITKFKLIGHSMGAYLSSCYLMKYNNNRTDGQGVDAFIIVSPMGTESSYNSLISNNKYEFNTHEIGGDPFRELDVFDDEHESKLIQFWADIGKPNIPKSMVLSTLWKYNKSPFQILQYFGPFYSKILSYWSFRRFRNLKRNKNGDLGNEAGEEDADEVTIHDDDNEEQEPSIDRDLILKLHNYSYSIFNQYTGSGELAITKLINHEILARLPLGERGLVDYLLNNSVKTLWVYGDKDWMNENGGLFITKQLQEKNPNITSYKIIKNAGHHIYLDNPYEFNKAAVEFFNLSN